MQDLDKGEQSAATAMQKDKDATLSHLIKGRLWALHRNSVITRNRVSRFIWPGSLFSLGMTIGGVAFVRLYEASIFRPIADKIEILEWVLPLSKDTHPAIPVICSCTLTSVAVFMLVTVSRRMLLRYLLSYNAWLYEPAGRLSIVTTIWGILVRTITGWSATLYSYQSSLPRMPVPPLKESMKNLIDSLAPVYANEPEKLEEFKREAKEFEKGLGPKLQRALVLRSWWADNFVSDWWKKYVYLMGRSPLPINSNYYIMDHGYWVPTKFQCARTASAIYQLLSVRDQIQTETLEPLVIRKTVPVCMEQYKNVFSTTRVPGLEMDTLVTHPRSKSHHVAVNRHGFIYKLDVTDVFGRPVCPSMLERQLELIMEDADKKLDAGETPEDERLIPVLTSLPRTEWAKMRNKFFSSGINMESLHWIESAIIYVVLESRSFDDLSSRAACLLHGRSFSNWYDKSLQLISMSDGHIGLNCEHSFADAPVIAHIFEFNLSYELLHLPASNVRSILGKLYKDDGHCFDRYSTPQSMLRSKPTLLQWEVKSELSDCIARAHSSAEKNVIDLDLLLFDHNQFGKGEMKKAKLSPDAFIQMALHATYRKVMGVAALTYEASMTRLFKHGRTETVRSLSKEADAFVQGFLDPDVPNEEKRSLLKKACDKHAVMYKDAMTGKGLDRHLFALYVASRGLGIDCEFLKKVLSIPWTLSTSQQPQQQIPWTPSCSDPKFHDQICPGGGFGPVADDGYGVSYMVAGDHRIFFHVTSRRSAPGTSSNRFLESLKESLREMKDLFY